MKITDAIFLGALDYLPWPFTDDDLRRSIARVELRCEAVLSVKSKAVQARANLSRLSGRELEVVAGMSDGLTNKGIARRLQISPRTVEVHRANAMGKLSASHSSEVVKLYFEAARRGT
ncbi:MAG: LuxR C-terminal-related transcriptional regulator [Novosphingobium sp.]|nr:LuxR C-terminal-related transcriptional regulator [Novosphingobium sp.]